MKIWNRNTFLSTLFLFGGFLLFAMLGDLLGDRLDLPIPFYLTATGLILLAVAGVLWPIYRDVPIDGQLGNPLYVALFYAGIGAWTWLATGLMSIGITGWLAFPGALVLAGACLLVTGGLWRSDTPEAVGLCLVMVFGLVCLVVGVFLVFPLGWGWLVLYLIGAVMTIPALGGLMAWLDKRRENILSAGASRQARR
ncbi:hypothetical protein [Lentzea sp. NPDC003310]|uniref:hypothetical protein n=1 Tax=Lentzea sp. NPDC003310 TaxID=3154447 RepID=UPI0033A18AE4